MAKIDINEIAARKVRRDKKQLRARLMAAAEVLYYPYRAEFRPARFDFKNACLWSRDRTMRLQWQVREFPNRAVSYRNQQTRRGCVILMMGDLIGGASK